MPSNSVDYVSPQQPIAPVPRPALVAYSDSDSENSFHGVAGPAFRLTAPIQKTEAAKGFSAQEVTNIAPTDSFAVFDTTLTLDTLEPRGTIATNQNTVYTQGNERHDQAKHYDVCVGDDDKTITDISNEAYSVDLETIFGEDDGEGDQGSNAPQCWGDIKYPRIGTCDHEFMIVNKGERYRKVVSDFFGRNKRATASIPTDFYPKLCRICYQRLAYRLASMNRANPAKDTAAVAKLRCDAILATLQKMKERKFIDRHGHEWPWWCGLELRLTNDGQALMDDPERLETEIQKKNDDVAKYKADRIKSPPGKSLKRLHKRIKPEYLPDWLQNLCAATPENYAGDSFAARTIVERAGPRYSFDELILIVKAIKTFCHQSRCAFPTIEALPVPLGLLDEQIFKEKRRLRAVANKEKKETKRAALQAEHDARDHPSSTRRKNRAVAKRKEADRALAVANAAERAVEAAREDAVLSAETIPGTRPKSDISSSKKFKVITNLNKMKANTAPESPPRSTNNNQRTVGAQTCVNDDDANDGDYEDIPGTRIPRSVKRVRISTTISKTKSGTWKDSYSGCRTKQGQDSPLLASTAEPRAGVSAAHRASCGLEPQKGKVLDRSSQCQST